jgi:predicted permease
VSREIAENAAGFGSLAAFDLEPVSVAGGGDPQTTLSLSVTASYFDVLAIEPSLGRFFERLEASPPASAAVAVVSERFWRTRLGGDASALGSTIRVNGTPVTVIGVGPPGFRGHMLVPVDVFLPLGAGVRGLSSAASLAEPGSGVVEMLGRVEPGASLDVVAESATQVGDRLLQMETGARPGGFRARVERWAAVPAVGRGPVSAFFVVLMTVVGAVLVVACINVAGMLLSRTVEREGEIALRQALGAGRGRLARQLLTESLLLFLGGGVAGVLLAAGLVRLLLTFEPPLPSGFEVPLESRLNGRVLAFAFTLTVATGVVFNLLPVLRASRLDLTSGLSAGQRGRTRGRSRARGVLIGAQMAVCLMLLVTAGLFLRSLLSVETLDAGWDARGVYAAELDVVLAGSDEVEGRAQLREILEAAGALPGVSSSALAAKLPLAGRSSLGDVIAAGVDPPPGRTGFPAAFNRVTPGYFETLGVSLLEGRPFGAGDVSGAEPVAIVSQGMAGVLWPNGGAVGERFYVGGVGSERSFLVIGVAENAAVRDLASDPEPFYYLPFEQWYNGQMTLLVRVPTPAAPDLPARIRGVIREAAPYLPVGQVLPLEERLSFFFLPQRLAAWVTGVVGLLGLVLAAVGVYGLTAVAVGLRLREIGVRLALGAPPVEVLLRVIYQGLRAPLIGCAVGILLALVLARVASSFLATISPTDPVAFLGAAATLLGAALLAAFVPALRAARTDPARSLMSE